MLKKILVVTLTLLILTGSALARLTTAPTAPIRVDTQNPRYFNYGSKTVSLVGISGEFVPQMNWVKSVVPSSTFPTENCGAHTQTFNNVTKKKYEGCIDRLFDAGLNVIRLWVALNHSPGRGFGNDEPFDLEQPYSWDSTARKWKMDTFDANYDKSLYDVVKYAQGKGVIVEITLFNPFISGSQTKSPWLKANHTMNLTIPSPDPCAGTGNSEFADLQLFVKGDKNFTFLGPAPNYSFPLAGQLSSARIDDNCQNVKTRMYQVQLAKHLVDLLNGRVFPNDVNRKQRLYNFYWELANEPDGKASNMQQSMNWHYFMAWQLREYEKSLYPGSYHLIAANYALQPLFEDALPKQSVKSYIDIIEAHYVKKGPVPFGGTSAVAASYTNQTPGGEEPDVTGGEDPPSEPDGEGPGEMGEVGIITSGHTTSGVMTAAATPTPVPALGAIEMIRTYNVYAGDPYAGSNVPKNTKLWGFNETRITGFTQDAAHPNPATPASARAEAWEFMLAGGAVYNNMGFNWGNLNPGQNVNSAEWTIDDLARLYGVIGDTNLDLKTMRRDERWITNLPVYGSAPSAGAANRYYAMMRNNDTFLYYKHNSRYSNHNLAAKYDPVIVVNGYTDRVMFKNPFNCAATFTSQWITPKANHPEIVNTGTITQETAQASVSLPWTLPANGTREIVSNSYNFDIALRIKKTAGCSTLTAGTMVQMQSNLPINAAIGAEATASSELSESYPASSVIDGDRTGAAWGDGGGWSDGTSGEYPDWIQIAYGTTRSISEVDVFTLRDNYTNGSGVTEDDPSALYGVRDFELQYRDPETREWLAVPNGIVSGNDKAWVRFIFEPIQTDAIRIVVHSGPEAENGIDDHSRIVEIETYGETPGDGEPGTSTTTY